MKEKVLLAFLTTLYFFSRLYAQETPSIQWQKCFGGNSVETNSCIQQTLDEGFIIAGYSGSNDSNVTGNHGGNDYWIVKTDATGNIDWQKSFGGSMDENCYHIEQTSDSG